MSLVLLSLTLLSAVIALPQLEAATSTIAELANTSMAIAAVKTSSKVKVKSGKKLRKGKLAGLIVGIIIAVTLLFLLIAFLLYKRQQKKKALMGEKGMVGGPGPGPEPVVGHQGGDIGMQQRQNGV